MTSHDPATVLVIDDEEPILRLAEAALLHRGLRVLTALSGRQALEVAAAHDGAIDLLLVDVVMPDINGPELAEILRERYPEAKLIFTSGYGLGAGQALKKRHDDAVYLTKPFGIAQLTRQVEQVLQG